MMTTTMTNDEIIRMAMVAGFNVTSERATKGFCGFAALVAAHEREACLACYSPDDTATDWADKIRARGEK